MIASMPTTAPEHLMRGALLLEEAARRALYLATKVRITGANCPATVRRLAGVAMVGVAELLRSSLEEPLRACSLPHRGETLTFLREDV